MKRILFLQKAELLADQRDQVVATLGAQWPTVTVDCVGAAAEVPAGVHYDAVITPTLPWLPDALARTEGYDWIHFLSAGVDAIWEMPFDKEGIVLTKSSGVHAIPIAEYVLGAMLYFAKNLDRYVAQSGERAWSPVWSDELTGRSVLVLGAGAVGSEVVRRCQMLGMKTLSVRYDDDLPALGSINYLVVCLPLTDATRGLVNAELLGQLAPGAVLIDVSRGGLTVGADVAEALDARRLRGAALDVFEDEPLPNDSALWDRKNVIISPHIAGSTPFYLERALEIFIANARCRDSGQRMVTPVDICAKY